MKQHICLIIQKLERSIKNVEISYKLIYNLSTKKCEYPRYDVLVEIEINWISTRYGKFFLLLAVFYNRN